jgi:Uma2 family endonuclease
MVSLASIPPGEYVPTADERIVLYNVPWSHFEVQLALRGDAPSPRMAYLDGALELMSPSKGHERTKSYIGRLIEVFAMERDVMLSPYGSWTLKGPPELAGVEPDECYIVGPDQDKERPDLAIEVIWTSGSIDEQREEMGGRDPAGFAGGEGGDAPRGIDKLEIYRRLQVGEVWSWKDGVLSVHVLSAGRYQKAERSALFPELDLALLCMFLDRRSATEAMRDFRNALRARP